LQEIWLITKTGSTTFLLLFQLSESEV